MPTSRMVAKGNASLPKSARLTFCSSARLLGPITESTVQAAVTSVRVAWAPAGMWRPIQSASRVTCAEPVTIMNLSCARRAMVRSLSKVPRSFRRPV